MNPKRTLETLNQLLLADKKKSVSSVAQYDEYIKKIKEDISVLMKIVVEIRKEVIGTVTNYPFKDE